MENSKQRHLDIHHHIHQCYLIFLCLVNILQSITGDCPSGYTERNSNSCYRVYTTSGNRDNAQQQCVSDGGNLVTLSSQTDRDYYTAIMVSEGISSIYYGCTLNSTDQWRYIANIDSSSVWATWVAGQPDNYEGYQTCAILDGYSNFHLRDINCIDSYEFICQNATGHYIKEGNNRKTFFEARNYCHETFGGDLAAIPNDGAFGSIKQNLATNAFYIIGLTNRVWLCGDGTTMPYSNWLSGEPNINDYPCTIMSQNGEMATARCDDSSSTTKFICEITGITTGITTSTITSTTVSTQSTSSTASSSNGSTSPSASSSTTISSNNVTANTSSTTTTPEPDSAATTAENGGPMTTASNTTDTTASTATSAAAATTTTTSAATTPRAAVTATTTTVAAASTTSGGNTTTTTSSLTGGNTAAATTIIGGLTLLEIILIVICIILVILIVIMIALCCYYKKRNNERNKVGVDYDARYEASVPNSGSVDGHTAETLSNSSRNNPAMRS